MDFLVGASILAAYAALLWVTGWVATRWSDSFYGAPTLLVGLLVHAALAVAALMAVMLCKVVLVLGHAVRGLP